MLSNCLDCAAGIAKWWLKTDLQRALEAATIPDCSHSGAPSCSLLLGCCQMLLLPPLLLVAGCQGSSYGLLLLAFCATTPAMPCGPCPAQACALSAACVMMRRWRGAAALGKTWCTTRPPSQSLRATTGPTQSRPSACASGACAGGCGLGGLCCVRCLLLADHCCLCGDLREESAVDRPIIQPQTTTIHPPLAPPPPPACRLQVCQGRRHGVRGALGHDAHL